MVCSSLPRFLLLFTCKCYAYNFSGTVYAEFGWNTVICECACAVVRKTFLSNYIHIHILYICNIRVCT